MNNLIKVTSPAWIQMKSIINNKSKIGFIFAASSGGCNGFNYSLKLLDTAYYNKIQDSQKIKPTILIHNNVKLLIDPMSEMFLIGTTIDYQTSDYDNNIFEDKFLFIPDKDIATSCGCGISFTPKN